ncbi:hypothetical protein P3X46_032039 [Hevea brasiliensis]|uniref:Uncharacterized protein n=1 Tax=Hevea brasiliensis TaxID=3981 RepID=A0ABQ9KQB9_HEVBR|nr:hypothetical protein P3X46_032039 [Hevea brasiliensis]
MALSTVNQVCVRERFQSQQLKPPPYFQAEDRNLKKSRHKPNIGYTLKHGRVNDASLFCSLRVNHHVSGSLLGPHTSLLSIELPSHRAKKNNTPHTSRLPFLKSSTNTLSLKHNRSTTKIKKENIYSLA